MFVTSSARFDRPDPDPAELAQSMSRRSLLGLMVAAPVLKALPVQAASNRLVVHEGWVLLATDLERLGL